MDEADGIILITLKDLGCEIEENETIKDFDSEMVYKCILSYLKVINENKVQNLTSTLPKNMSARVNSCSLIANIIKDLGYRAELSYHNLLYPNVNDIRRIFIFLGQSLPKKEIETASKTMKLEDQICQYLQGCVKESWMPYFCPFSKRIPGNYSTAKLFTANSLKIPSRGRSVKTVPGLEQYYINNLEPLTLQTNRSEDIAPSVFEYNLSIYAEAQERENEWNNKGSSSGLNPIDYRKSKMKQVLSRMNDSIRASNIEGGSSASFGNDSLQDLIGEFRGGFSDVGGQFSRKKLFTNEQIEATSIQSSNQVAAEVETEEQRQMKRQQEIDELQSQIDQISEQIQQYQREMQDFVSLMRQAESENIEQDTQREGLEKQYKIKKKTFALLDDAEGNMKELQGLCNQTSANLLEMSAEWEKVRRPIIEKYRSLKDKQMNQADEAKSKLDRIKEMRQLIKKLVQEVQQKEEQFQQLQEAYKNAPKDSNRSIYTRRILETVKNIKKQKVDIDKVLLDTKNLQKEINTVTDTAVRTFELVKDLLYNDAKKDVTAKQAIKSFAIIDDKFQKLFKTIDDTGSFQNNILTLHSKIEHITQKTNTLNSDRVVKDLSNIKAENQNLIKQIRVLMETSN
ncbi:hypothetical protein DICPUDRAFT_158810 [Dictyostelium purpureum]|uniref:Coiled-coil domain-containing protein 22 homolog n=1 Tax=Dictyostelium purpureum TaxID=5786 RepID=F1A2J7_DICPU|nr:uncharacterized protein DICPUDRAFT_158810 [Dictyostelium purpureum]EGC29584.1 hypothetical protein DICPUDRAFT_158810 [Dictyostelium purpureum]|eukprot:XP_003293886.1 hypothetical protein DICPUDRAFT_158810 [Dictyostelium purpureum]